MLGVKKMNSGEVVIKDTIKLNTENLSWRLLR